MIDAVPSHEHPSTKAFACTSQASVGDTGYNHVCYTRCNQSLPFHLIPMTIRPRREALFRQHGCCFRGTSGRSYSHVAFASNHECSCADYSPLGSFSRQPRAAFNSTFSPDFAVYRLVSQAWITARRLFQFWSLKDRPGHIRSSLRQLWRRSIYLGISVPVQLNTYLLLLLFPRTCPSSSHHFSN
jgi:hypothetical protein